MKTKNFVLSGILGIALSGLVLTGCHKSSTTPDTDITAAQDESNGTFASNDTKSVSDAGIQDNGTNLHSVKAIYSPVCTVTWNDTNSSAVDSMYINFGSAPVECADHRWRQGEIIVYWNKVTGNFARTSYWATGATVYMTFRGYYVGDYSNSLYGVSGTRSWTNAGLNANNNENWNFSAALTITYPSGGGTATWNSTRNNVLEEVGSTWYYVITGSASGVTRKGYDYNVTIASPLYITANPWWVTGGCAWIESGVVDISRPSVSSNTLSINFGTVGTCDAQATATLNGNTYTIYMW